MKRKYPYKAWRLNANFKLVEVEIVGLYFEVSHPEVEKTSDGNMINVNELFSTKEEAIAHGRRKIEEMKADIEKRKRTMEKRIKALDQAEVSND